METVNWMKLIGGIIAFVIGIVFLISIIRKPIDRAEDTNKHNLQGVISSVVAIVLGVLLMINSFG